LKFPYGRRPGISIIADGFPSWEDNLGITFL
jgi:hypothetical protein